MLLRDYELETKKRTAFIRDYLASAGAAGVVFGNSGGKDSALAGILCKLACGDTVGVIMPIHSKSNLGQDKTDALALAEQFGIESREVDLSPLKSLALALIGGVTELNQSADINISPRLRMLTLYAVAASENRLVCGTGNRSESYMGYFTKWGDGGCDFNPIGDLTVREIYEYLDYFEAPESIRKKHPSAGLFDGQTDEAEMGISYDAIDDFLLSGEVSDADFAIIDRYHRSSAHKRRLPMIYPGE